MASAAVEVGRGCGAEATGDHHRRIAGGLPDAGIAGKHPLKDAHAALDAAVLAAYGFDAKKDLLAQLLDLNLKVSSLEKQGKKVTASRGVPASYGDGKKPDFDIVPLQEREMSCHPFIESADAAA